MSFHGEISKFFPPDLLEYLASFGRDGVLTVKEPEPLLITIKEGCVVDAFSSKADAKLLRTLYYRQFISKEKYQYIGKARSETSLSIRQILSKLKLFPLASIQAELIMAIEDVIFQFFQLKAGAFAFNETSINYDITGTKLYPLDLMYDLTAQVDEWNEYQAALGNMSQIVSLTESGSQAQPANKSEDIIYRMISGESSIEKLVNQAPLPRFFALKFIANGVRKGWFALAGGKEVLVPAEKKQACAKPDLFLDFKRGFKEVLQADSMRRKVEHTLQFCKNHFDVTLMLSVHKGKLARGLIFRKDAEGRLYSEAITKQPVIEEDQILVTACEKGLAFFGKVYASSFFESLVELPAQGECGLIPIEVLPGRAKLIFAVNSQMGEGMSPLHFLDLLSWIIAPAQAAKISNEMALGMPENIGEDKAAKLIALTDELPPMPHVVGQALKIIADPESSLEALATVLAQDQSLLAMIIKVSNSALYSTGQEVSSLQTAITKLGVNIVRSLVLTASTQSVFPKDDVKIGRFGKALWGHSKECGLAARRLAQIIGYPDPEEAFVGGLLHDIGRLAILMGYPEEFREIDRLNCSGQKGLIQAEQELLGFDHTVIGQMLAQKWRMPSALLACVEQHHRPQEATDSFLTLANITAMADYLSIQVGKAPGFKELDEWHGIKIVQSQLGLDDAKLSKLEKQLHEDFRQVDIFDVA
ncbi:MAG: HDOD domain-containing protein [Proteobacteria bacterium]|nr:HDOD domain-containing protein [Pseudomonadota bacterium]MBU1640574.1 HDOD domain-containing protein [Pseudomonadota bacterium]